MTVRDPVHLKSNKKPRSIFHLQLLMLSAQPHLGTFLYLSFEVLCRSIGSIVATGHNLHRYSLEGSIILGVNHIAYGAIARASPCFGRLPQE